MYYKTIIILISLLIHPQTYSQAAVPDDYLFKGSGIVYYLGIFKVYNATLYTESDARLEDVLSADCSRCLELDYAVDLKVENFIEAADIILARQLDEKNLNILRPELDQLNASYRDVREGDRYLLCYDSETQTTRLLLNGNLLVEIPSAEFATAYFGIWLGDKKAIDTDLRSKLLAGFTQ
jgi:hypothetical protein